MYRYSIEICSVLMIHCRVRFTLYRKFVELACSRVKQRVPNEVILVTHGGRKERDKYFVTNFC